MSRKSLFLGAILLIGATAAYGDYQRWVLNPLVQQVVTGIYGACPDGSQGCFVPGTSSGGGIPVQPPIPAVVVTGQVAIAVTNTAVQLPSNALVNGLVVKAKSTNSASCGTVGKSGTTNTYDGTGNGYGLCPGEASSFAIPNSNLLFVNGTVGDIFTFEGN